MTVYFGVSSSFHLISRLAIVSLAAISPAIPSALSVYIPVFTFILNLIRYFGNKLLVDPKEDINYHRSLNESSRDSMFLLRLIILFILIILKL